MPFATTGAIFVKMVGTTNNTATAALATQCITDAENEIKKRLCKRYDFSASPFLTTTTYPPMIITLTENLAIGYMYESLARGGKESFVRADRFIKRVMDNLEQLQNGDAQLVGVSGTAVDEISGDWAIHATDSYPNTFNEDDPKDWSPSQDKLDAISDERD
jgi:hypothetical protein